MLNNQIRQILLLNKKARNSDKELIIEVWKANGLRLTQDQIAIFKKLPSTESIRRTRQKIQENGEFLADNNIRRTRKNKADLVRSKIAREPEPQKLFEDEVVWR